MAPCLRSTLSGTRADHVPIEVPLGEFDEVEPEPLGLGLGQVRAGDEPQREQDLAEILPGIVLLGLQRQAHLLLAYLALVDEDVGDLIDVRPSCRQGPRDKGHSA